MSDAKRAAMLTDTIVAPGIIFNPGTGNVRGATLDNATANIAAFVADLGDGWTWRRGSAEDDYDAHETARHGIGGGRFCFHVSHPDHGEHEIQMPGWPLGEVRWEQGSDPWPFPRLYVDGSSWLWGFALSACFRDDDDAETEARP